MNESNRLLEQRDEELTKQNKKLKQQQQEMEKLYQEQIKEMERISGLTTEEAKELIISKLKNEMKHETAQIIKEMEQEAIEEGDKTGAKILSLPFNVCSRSCS